MTYEVRIGIDAADFLNSQDEKTQSIIKDNLGKLKKEPYPSPEAQSGDREKVTVNSEETYRCRRLLNEISPGFLSHRMSLTNNINYFCFTENSSTSSLPE